MEGVGVLGASFLPRPRLKPTEKERTAEKATVKAGTTKERVKANGKGNTNPLQR